MRHSSTHLVVAFCTGMAVSAAPLSPLPPASPAALSPLPVLDAHPIIPRADSHDFENTYNLSDAEGIRERDTTGEGLNDSAIMQSEAKDMSAEDFSFEVDPGEESDIERRSAFSIYNRSPTPYPQNIEEDEDQDFNGAENDNDLASVASFSESPEEEDGVSSAASDGVFSAASENVDPELEASSSDAPNKEENEKRSVETGDQSERHGGRTYITESEWRV